MLEQFNSQLMSKLEADISYAVVGSRLDQNVRAGTLDAQSGARIQGHLDKAEAFEGGPQARAAKAQLDAAAASLQNRPGQELLIEDILELRASLG